MGHGGLKLYRGDETDEELGLLEKADEQFYAGRACDLCGEEFYFTDEVFLLEVAEAAEENGVFFHDHMTNEEGEYLYVPYVMHLVCWEEVLEEVDEIIADQPVVETDEFIEKCSRCRSGIGNFDPFIASTFGELRMSPRQPNGEPTAMFTKLSTMTPVCIPCITHVIEDYFEEWEELLEFLPEERPEGDNEDE